MTGAQKEPWPSDIMLEEHLSDLGAGLEVGWSTWALLAFLGADLSHPCLDSVTPPWMDSVASAGVWIGRQG